MLAVGASDRWHRRVAGSQHRVELAHNSVHGVACVCARAWWCVRVALHWPCHLDGPVVKPCHVRVCRLAGCAALGQGGTCNIHVRAVAIHHRRDACHLPGCWVDAERKGGVVHASGRGKRGAQACRPPLTAHRRVRASHSTAAIRPGCIDELRAVATQPCGKSAAHGAAANAAA